MKETVKEMLFIIITKKRHLLMLNFNFNIFFNKQMYVVLYHCIFGVFGLLEPKFELELENKLLRYCSHCFSCKILANFVENLAQEIKNKKRHLYTT